MGSTKLLKTIKATKVKKKKKNRLPQVVTSKLTKEQSEFLDYKDVETLTRFTSGVGKILSRKRAATSTRQQQSIRQAIKLSRFMALMPYVSK